MMKQQVKFLPVNFPPDAKAPPREREPDTFCSQTQLFPLPSETILAFELHCKFDFRTVEKSRMCLTFIPVHPLRFDFTFHVIQFSHVIFKMKIVRKCFKQIAD